MLQELARHFAAGQSFAFETTLAGRGYVQHIKVWQAAGYRVKLIYLRNRYGHSYRYLSEQTGDSLSMRAFLNVRPGEQISKSAINSNLKRVQESTLVKFNACLLKYAEQKGHEDGKSLRGDTTSTETNIHYPTDASLLNDSVRVLTRIMNRLLSWTDVEFPT